MVCAQSFNFDQTYLNTGLKTQNVYLRFHNNCTQVQWKEKRNSRLKSFLEENKGFTYFRWLAHQLPNLRGSDMSNMYSQNFSVSILSWQWQGGQSCPAAQLFFHQSQHSSAISTVVFCTVKISSHSYTIIHGLLLRSPWIIQWCNAQRWDLPVFCPLFFV